MLSNSRLFNSTRLNAQPYPSLARTHHNTMPRFGEAPVIDAYEKHSQFKFDPPQVEAIQHIHNGKSVLVVAPTGTGKTAIAEFALFQTTRNKGQKAFYTTPLKALSNDKFREFCEKFGKQNVGLLTGDISINRDAPIVIMTTEVYRNMLFGNEDSGLLDTLKYVVFDEVHYMNDEERGTVWEESITHCPPGVQMISLSATVRNSKALTEWMNKITPTELVEVPLTERAVPLKYAFYHMDKLQSRNRSRLEDMFEEKPGTKGEKVLTAELQKYKRTQNNTQSNHQNHRKNRHFRNAVKQNKVQEETQKPILYNDLLVDLYQQDKLPAIVFLMGRSKCDQSLMDTERIDFPYNSAKAAQEKPETRRRQIIIDEYVKTHPFLQNHPHLPMLKNGFAAHHAGLLPDLKRLVEMLMKEKLLKAVFATSTLAAGINMPARSTVITSLARHSNEGLVDLSASEFHQMAGRAGRRGKDNIGHVIIVENPYDTVQQAAQLINKTPEALESRFQIGYGLVLRYLQRFSMKDIQAQLEKTFAHFDIQQYLNNLRTALGNKKSSLEGLNRSPQAAVPVDVKGENIAKYLKLQEQFKELDRTVTALSKGSNKNKSKTELQSAKNALTKIEKELKQYPNCQNYSIEALKSYQAVSEERNKLQTAITDIQQKLNTLGGKLLNQFNKIVTLLQKPELGYIDDSTQLTTYGKMANQLKIDNELFLSECILKGYFNDLSPGTFAGVIAAMIHPDGRRELHLKNFKPSSEANRALIQLEKEKERLEIIQTEAEINIPINLNADLTGLVEAWARGMSWKTLRKNSPEELFEGDVVRLLRRTVDLLQKIETQPSAIPPELSEKAREAIKLIDRPPVQDTEFTSG